jgi:hypothetical protein
MNFFHRLSHRVTCHRGPFSWRDIRKGAGGERREEKGPRGRGPIKRDTVIHALVSDAPCQVRLSHGAPGVVGWPRAPESPPKSARASPVLPDRFPTSRRSGRVLHYSIVILSPFILAPRFELYQPRVARSIRRFNIYDASQILRHVRLTS